MRGARLILLFSRPKYRGRQNVVVRSRLAAVCEIQITRVSCSDASEQWGSVRRYGLGMIVLALANRGHLYRCLEDVECSTMG